MKLELASVAAILAMAVATYATRVCGLWLVRYLQSGPVLQAALNAVPVAVLTAVIAPSLAKGGLADLAAAAVTVTAAFRLPLLAAVLIGVVAAIGFRALLA